MVLSPPPPLPITVAASSAAPPRSRIGHRAQRHAKRTPQYREAVEEMGLLGSKVRIGIKPNDLRRNAGTQPLGRYHRESTDARPNFDQRDPKFLEAQSDSRDSARSR